LNDGCDMFHRHFKWCLCYMMALSFYWGMKLE
jgi:hypothetical protein